MTERRACGQVQEVHLEKFDKYNLEQQKCILYSHRHQNCLATFLHFTAEPEPEPYQIHSAI